VTIVPSSAVTTAVVTLAPGHAYRYAVRAVGAGGSRSAWAFGTTFRLTAYSEKSGAVTFGGAWWATSSSAFVGGTSRHAKAAGASATFRFTARQVAWVAAVGPTRGQARVYVDGAYAKTVSLYSTSATARQVAFTRTWSSSGSHSIRIVVLGTAGHPRVDVDAFVTVR
jgi:hypothetical protein